MNFISLNSSRIKKAAFIDAENTLILAFNDGKEYEYYDVPKSVYGSLITSKSPGKFFETLIKNKYSYERTK